MKYILTAHTGTSSEKIDSILINPTEFDSLDDAIKHLRETVKSCNDGWGEAMIDIGDDPDEITCAQVWSRSLDNGKSEDHWNDKHDILMELELLARVFEDVNGYYVCNERGPLDTRGRPYPTKKDAMERAKECGYAYAVGSGTYKTGITKL